MGVQGIYCRGLRSVEIPGGVGNDGSIDVDVEIFDFSVAHALTCCMRMQNWRTERWTCVRMTLQVGFGRVLVLLSEGMSPPLAEVAADAVKWVRVPIRIDAAEPLVCQS